MRWALYTTRYTKKCVNNNVQPHYLGCGGGIQIDIPLGNAGLCNYLLQNLYYLILCWTNLTKNENSIIYGRRRPASRLEHGGAVHLLGVHLVFYVLLFNNIIFCSILCVFLCIFSRFYVFSYNNL